MQRKWSRSSLSYNWSQDQNVWETEEGMRVPRKCQVTVGYTVLHGTPPELNTPINEWYGLKQRTSQNTAEGLGFGQTSAASTAAGLGFGED